MTWFGSAVDSQADISAVRADVWQVLTDPILLPRLTPLLRRIDVDGDTWRWHLSRIVALGVSLSPVFTETMTFTPEHRIEYHHTPPPDGPRERAGAEGVYYLADIDGGTHLSISLALTIDVPLPRAATSAVESVIRIWLQRTGDHFAANLLRHLDAHELPASRP
jgi:carbon monoxide dehydrogenase subunit G